MFRSIPHIAGPRPAHLTPLGGFLAMSSLIAAGLIFASLYALGTARVPTALFATTVSVAAYGLIHSYVHPVLGLCNVMTLLRTAMVAFLAGAVMTPDVSAWLVFAVALIAFALDGVDGWLARRAGLVSDFGARFDMETDAALGAVISLWLLTSSTAGVEVLALGFMRYAFVAASFLWPALRAPLPEAFRRKAICAVQIAALILLVFPLTPQTIALPVAGFAAVLLGWSFLIDILWLIRRAA